MYRNVNVAGPDTRYNSSAAETAAAVLTGAAWLGDVLFTNGSGADLYVQVFDAAAVPADGAVPVCAQLVPNNTTAGLSFNRLPINTGIAVCASSTVLTKTVAGAGAGIFVVTYTKRP